MSKWIYIVFSVMFIALVIIFLLPVSPAQYHVREIPNFLTSEECDLIIKIAKQKGLQNSGLYEGNIDTFNTNVRQSSQAWLYDSEDMFIKELSSRISKLINIPVSHQEALQLVHYGIGDKYEPHYDACKTDCNRMNGKAGHRYLTVLIYLNDVEEGGETRFPMINTSIKPEKGKIVVFKNVSLKTNAIILEAQHGGDPVIKGEKWIANKWIHINPYD